jgi:Fe-Mn family superoxide dismutase
MYTQKDFSHLLGLAGFSDTMLSNHFTLYAGYVTNANKVITLLDTVEKGGYEYAELKRRLGWEVNGIKLHELYFENMSNVKSIEGAESENISNFENNENIKAKILEAYGSFDEYKASLKRNGMTRGIGWVLLIQDEATGKIFHTWVGEHNIGNIINAKILMVMDCWEHAYMTDYGIKRADYIEAFTNAIDWKVVESRI